MDYSTIELLYYLTYSLLFIVIVISVYSILKYVINKETKNIINIYYISSCGVFISYLVLFFHFYDSEIDTQLLLLSSITMSENQIYSGFTANIHRLYLEGLLFIVYFVISVSSFVKIRKMEEK